MHWIQQIHGYHGSIGHSKRFFLLTWAQSIKSALTLWCCNLVDPRHRSRVCTQSTGHGHDRWGDQSQQSREYRDGSQACFGRGLALWHLLWHSCCRSYQVMIINSKLSLWDMTVDYESTFMMFYSGMLSWPDAMGPLAACWACLKKTGRKYRLSISEHMLGQEFTMMGALTRSEGQLDCLADRYQAF